MIEISCNDHDNVNMTLLRPPIHELLVLGYQEGDESYIDNKIKDLFLYLENHTEGKLVEWKATSD